MGGLCSRQSSTASTLGHSTTTRYPRRGRITRLGPPKRTSRLSGDSLEEPSEVDTPPDSQKPVSSVLRPIPSNGTVDDPPRTRPTSFSVHGQYTPPASQSTPPVYEKPMKGESPLGDIRQLSTPEGQDALARRVSGSSSSVVSVGSMGSNVTSASRSLGRSGLRNLIASTSQYPTQQQQQQKQSIDVALETVQKGIEALSARRQDDSQSRIVKVPAIRHLLCAPGEINVKTPGVSSHTSAKSVSPRPSPAEEIVKSSQNEDINGGYVPLPDVKINILHTRRKSGSPEQRQQQSQPSSSSPPVHKRAVSSDVQVNYRRVPSVDHVHRPRVASVDIPISHPMVVSQVDAGNNHIRIPSNEPLPPPKMRGLSTTASPSKSPIKKGKAIVLVCSPPPLPLRTPLWLSPCFVVSNGFGAGKRAPIYPSKYHRPRGEQ
jgi:hypothetical protein